VLLFETGTIIEMINERSFAVPSRSLILIFIHLLLHHTGSTHYNTSTYEGPVVIYRLHVTKHVHDPI